MFYRIKVTEYEELKHLAYHDSLTDLLNRNWLQKNVYNIKHRYVYFIDINNLRYINEKGHNVGDNHIIMIVNSIFLRKGEIFMRYAGDEFLLFSDIKNRIQSNSLYSVGVSINNGNIRQAINESDHNMLKCKRVSKKRI